jgi:Bifunctional DNA primase/polymerase, N-terminal/Primase C terminal 1 (PriCT-1)
MYPSPYRLSADQQRRKVALACATSGRPVFPVGRNKQPLVPKGYLAATTDEATIRSWWARWPWANIGMPTGAITGIVVLDVDGDVGTDSVHELELRHGALPRTLNVRTPSGGQHFYFRHPGRHVGCSVGSVAPGLDVRGDGGYVLVPPSVAYEVDEQAPVRAMPDWLDDAVAQSAQGNGRAQPASTWLRLLDGIPTGERNDDLTRLAGHLLRRRIDVDVTTVLVHLVNEARCRPSLPHEEVERLLESVARAELRRRRGAGR